MNEKFMDKSKAEGMCTHGNFPSSCKTCNKTQDVDVFEFHHGVFEEDATNKNGNRKEASREDQERTDRQLMRLSEIFQDSGVRWTIDGAINISFAEGAYIGVHKDIDISIEDKDLEKAQEAFERAGYGFFLSTNEVEKDGREKRSLRRVGATEFRDTGGDHTTIAAIDAGGRVLTDQELNFIDLHIISRNSDGDPLSMGAILMPREWFEAQIETHNGKEYRFSHPAKVAYFKLHDERSYDEYDLKKLVETGELKREDADRISEIIDQEISRRNSIVDKVINEVAAKTDSESSVDEIFRVIAQVPEVRESVKDSPAQVQFFAEKFAGVADRTPANLRLIIEIHSPITETSDRLKSRVERFKQLF